MIENPPTFDRTPPRTPRPAGPVVSRYGRYSGRTRKGPCVNGCGMSVTWEGWGNLGMQCCSTCHRGPGGFFVHGPQCDQLPTIETFMRQYREEQARRHALRAEVAEQQQRTRGPTKCPNCSYLVTWHPTHCCGACAKNPGKHGPKCERRPFEEVAQQAT